MVDLKRRVRLSGRGRRFIGSVGISNLGDGMLVVILPLLGATLTDDPTVIAALAAAGAVPALVFALPVGGLVDRVSRGRLVVSTNAVRAVLVGFLATAVLTGQVRLWHLFAVAIVLGTAELLFDTGAQALLPRLVPRHQLPRTNGYLATVTELTDGVIGPAIGGLLFAVTASMPFLATGFAFAIAGAVLFPMVWRSAPAPAATGSPPEAGAPEEAPAAEPPDEAPASGAPPQAAAGAPPGADPAGTDSPRGGAATTDPPAGTDSPRADTAPAASPAGADRPPSPAAETPAEGRLRAFLRDIGDGLRWLARNRTLRPLAVVVAGSSLLGWLPEATFVLYVKDELGVGELGYGLLFAAISAGAVLGGLVSGPLVERLGAARVMLIALFSYALLTVPPAFLSSAVAVGVVLFVQGLPMIAWSVISHTALQSLVPDHLLGRVFSVFGLLGAGLAPVGLLLGGLLANQFGLRAVFVISGVGLALVVLFCVRGLRRLSGELAASLADSDVESDDRPAAVSTAEPDRPVAP